MKCEFYQNLVYGYSGWYLICYIQCVKEFENDTLKWNLAEFVDMTHQPFSDYLMLKSVTLITSDL